MSEAEEVKGGRRVVPSSGDPAEVYHARLGRMEPKPVSVKPFGENREEALATALV